LVIDEALRDRVRIEIDAVAQNFSSVPGSILTEDDLKCLLFSRLSRIPEVVAPERTRDADIRASALHAEIPWFGADKKLSIRPDITIVEPRNLLVRTRSTPQVGIPHKGFEFSGDAIIFELKFIRNLRGITNIALRAIRKDVDKIRGLKRKLETQGPSSTLWCFFVIFAKVDRVSQEFTEFVEAQSAVEGFTFIHRAAGI